MVSQGTPRGVAWIAGTFSPRAEESWDMLFVESHRSLVLSHPVNENDDKSLLFRARQIYRLLVRVEKLSWHASLSLWHLAGVVVCWSYLIATDVDEVNVRIGSNILHTYYIHIVSSPTGVFSVSVSHFPYCFGFSQWCNIFRTLG